MMMMMSGVYKACGVCVIVFNGYRLFSHLCLTTICYCNHYCTNTGKYVHVVSVSDGENTCWIQSVCARYNDSEMKVQATCSCWLSFPFPVTRRHWCI